MLLPTGVAPEARLLLIGRALRAFTDRVYVPSGRVLVSSGIAMVPLPATAFAGV